MPKRTRVLLATALAVALAAGAAVSALWSHGFFFRPDASRYPMLGIDVSHHQGRIDWTRVPQDDVSFAYLKATEGTDFKDDRFLENWRGAKAAGLLVGAYHFFSFCSPGAAQAEHFLATLPSGEPMLPPALDLELGGSCRGMPGRDAVRLEVLAFLQLVEARTGRKPLLYVTDEAFDSFLQRGDLDSIAGTGPLLWCRSLFDEPRLPYPVNWTFWQYHARGRVSGIERPVDLNVADFPRNVLLGLNR